MRQDPQYDAPASAQPAQWALRDMEPPQPVGRRWLVFLLLVVWPMGARPALAQQADSVTGGPLPALERQLLFSISTAEAPAFRYAMEAAHASAFPVFYAAPVAAWGIGLLTRAEGGLAAAYRLTAAQGATTGLVLGLKQIVERRRPFRTVSGITSRAENCSREHLGCGPFSFPSGHAAMAFTIATSVSLSLPQWYVVAPAFTWASSVALSRVWLGVHYPSDILAGAALGASVALGVHLLGSLITPTFLRADEGAPPSVSLFYLRIPIP